MAAEKVFQLPELLGEIFSHLDPLFLVSIRNVSKTFHDTITTSFQLTFHVGRDGHFYGSQPTDAAEVSEGIFTPTGLHVFSCLWKELASEFLRVRGNPEIHILRIFEVFMKYESVITKVRMFNPRVRVIGWEFLKCEAWNGVGELLGCYPDVFFEMTAHPLYKEYLPLRMMVDLLSFLYGFMVERAVVEEGVVDPWEVGVGFEVKAVVCQEGCDDEYDDEDDEESSGESDSDEEVGISKENGQFKDYDKTCARSSDDKATDVEVYSVSSGNDKDDPYADGNNWRQDDVLNLEYCGYDGKYVCLRPIPGSEPPRAEPVHLSRDKVGRMKYPKIMEQIDKENMGWEACAGCEKITETVMFSGIGPWGLKVESSRAKLYGDQHESEWSQSS
ncbi:hypothetical protein TWF718_007898 [Orbilia javanica]|uniref:F-box domain-containing protein n=1 Tax=Orbilia javanica TaxID=47235 RepID=A0AAN8N079_9PEZI